MTRSERIGVALAVAGLLAYVASLGLTPIHANDTWIHLTTGRLILEEGSIPTQDRYSFTAAGNRYVAHEWLAAALYAWGERVAGLPGVLLVAKLLPALALAGALLWACGASGASWSVSLPLAVLALVAARERIVERPELPAMTLLLASLALLWRERRRAREGRLGLGLLALAPIAAVWANLHASVALGIALVGLFAAAEGADHWLDRSRPRAGRARVVAGIAIAALAAGLAAMPPRAFGLPAAALVAAGGALVLADGRFALFEATERIPLRRVLRLPALAVLCIAATLANPRGAEMLRFPFEFTVGVNPVTRAIREWRPLLDPSPVVLDSVALGAFLLFVALWGIGLGLAAARGRLGRLELGLLLFFGVLVLRHTRWIALATLATTPALAVMWTALARDGPRLAARRAGLASAGAGLGLASGVLALALAARARPDLGFRLTLGVAAACALALPPIALVPRLRRAGPWVAAAAALALVGLGTARGVSFRPGLAERPDWTLRGVASVFPDVHGSPGVAFLRAERIPGRLFTEYAWAGRAIHQLWPDVRVFIDSRSEVYGPALLELYGAMKAHAAFARRGLTLYDVDLVLVRYRPFPSRAEPSAGMLDVVERDPAWALLYADDHALLYARRDRDRPLPAPLDGLWPRRLTPLELLAPDAKLEARLGAALARAPHSSFLRFALASQLRASGRLDEARRELARAWAANPRQAAAPHLAGELAAQAGELAAARRWFERAVRADPHWSLPRSRLAELAR